MKYSIEKLDVICWSFDKKFTIITIENDKSKTPNFHIVDRKTFGENFDCQISMITSRYIKNSKSILNNDQIRKLDKLWNRKFVIPIYGTYWNWMINCWNFSNSKKIDNQRKKPNYKQLY